MIGLSDENCAPTIEDKLLERQLNSIIEIQLSEIGFTGICKRIATNVVEKVRRIDEEHKEIKQIFDNLGGRLDTLLADQEHELEEGAKSSTTTQGKKSIIIIADDDGYNGNDNNGGCNENCVSVKENDKKESLKTEVFQISTSTKSKSIPTSSERINEGSTASELWNSKLASKCRQGNSKTIENIVSNLKASKTNLKLEGQHNLNELFNANESITEDEQMPLEIIDSSKSDIGPANTKRLQTNPDKLKNEEERFENKIIETKIDLKHLSVLPKEQILYEEQLSPFQGDDQNKQHEDIQSGNLFNSNVLTEKNKGDEDSISMLQDTSTNNLTLNVTYSNTVQQDKIVKNTSADSLPPDLSKPLLKLNSPAENPPDLSNSLLYPKSADKKAIDNDFDTYSDRKLPIDTSNDVKIWPHIDPIHELDVVSSEIMHDVCLLQTPTTSTKLNLPFKDMPDIESTASILLPLKEDMSGSSLLIPKILESDTSNKLVTKIRLPEDFSKKSDVVPKNSFSLKSATIVYAKPANTDIWYKAALVKQVLSSKRQKKLLVQFQSGQKLRQKISLHNIASIDPAKASDIEIGSRVVACRPSDTVNSTISKKYKDIGNCNSANVKFAGIVAELACKQNSHRYLVFFDDGYAQYIGRNGLFLAIKPSENVWDDVAKDCQEFVKEYLQEYPFRPLVVTKINSTMQTEWNGSWWKSKVVSIDASLVKILFDVDKRSEWIYRGTTRLEPMYNHYVKPAKKTTRMKQQFDSYVDEKITHPSFGISKYSLKDPTGKKQREIWNVPSPKANRKLAEEPLDNYEDVSLGETTSCSSGTRRLKRSVSAVSSSSDSSKGSDTKQMKKQKIQTDYKTSPKKEQEVNLMVSSKNADGQKIALQVEVDNQVNSPSILDQENTLLAYNPITASCSVKTTSIQTMSNSNENMICQSSSSKAISPAPSPVSKTINRGPHQCNEDCICDRHEILLQFKETCNYFAIPLFLGWKRESCKRQNGYKRDIYYQTPCNRRLRNLGEVTRYLLETKSTNVCIDMFCFMPSISCRNTTQKSKPGCVRIEDISNGKESRSIACVNEYNDELPPSVTYVASRIKTDDVNINTDPNFLVCCDCTDNCQDKSKCSCAQLTIESSKVIDNDENPNAGYTYRRLKEQLVTGIYECNMNCSCSRDTCYNRVVQNGINLRLQVFRTEDRGWGLRCVDDIPKGTFVCTYAGQVLNEQTANREGMDYGDEYLAELDHIEVVEEAKEGYESDVAEFKDYNDSSDDSSSEDSGSEISVLLISSDSSESCADGEEDSLDATDESQQKKNKISSAENVTANEHSRVSWATSSTSSSSNSPPPKLGKNVVPCRIALERIQSSQLPKINNQLDDSSVTDECSNTDSANSLLSPLASSTTVCFGKNCDASQEDTGGTVENKNNQDNKCELVDDTQSAFTVCKGFNMATSNTETKCDGENAKVVKPVARKSTGQKVRKTAIKQFNGSEKVVTRPSTRLLYNGDNQMFIIDAKSYGNVGRYMNHCCEPNVFVQNVLVDTHDLRFPWVAFFTQQNIPAYTELTWDYSYEIGSVPGKEMSCKCGSKQCKGRLL